jgi:hypothetical protein
MDAKITGSIFGQNYGKLEINEIQLVITLCRCWKIPQL